jgi:hypothetical protein
VPLLGSESGIFSGARRAELFAGHRRGKTYVVVRGASSLLGSVPSCGETLNSLFSSGKSHLLGAAVGVGVALIALALRYPGSSVPMTVATILLFCGVFAYVLLSHENIKLLREQFARQELVFVDFGLRLDEAGALSVWAANLGTSNFVIRGVDVRTQERSAPHRALVHIVVPAGRVESEIPFDDRIFDTLHSDAFVHFDVSLRCSGLAENRQTRWKGYTVERRPRRQLDEGFTGLWGVACPKCSRFDFMSMRTVGLTDLEAAWRRQAELESDLRSSCPGHHSTLLLPSNGAKKQFAGVS